MKTMNKKLWMLSMLMLMLGLTSCEFDPYYHDGNVGYTVRGHWFGDLAMCMGQEKARGSEIEFRPLGYDYTYGEGTEVDYYYAGTMVHQFDYEIRNGVIYLYFDDPELNCRIRDYRLNNDYFTGYMDGYDVSVRFSLRNYDRYWRQYGYGGYYNSREQGMSTDSLTTRSADAPKCVRGVNRKKDAQ